ncbi:MAG: ATP-binding protein [Bacteroidota bacterium]
MLRALHDLCQRIQKLNGLDVHFHTDQPYTFTKQQDLAIYRIIQELLNNTLKHAQASTITLHFEQHPTALHIRYSDNGQGMNPTEIQALSTGLGFKSIETRVNLINGTLEVTSEKGQGIQVTITLPSREILDIT